MKNYPHAELPLDKALWCVRHGRTHEMVLTGLGRSDLDQVQASVDVRIQHARRRHLKAHVAGASLTAVFIAVGLPLALLGPSRIVAWTQAGTHIRAGDQIIYWTLLVVVLATGASAADYILRRRLRAAKRFGRALDELRAVHAKIDSARDALPAPSD